MKKSNLLLATTALSRSVKLAVMTGAMVLASSSAWAVDDLATPTGEVVVGGSASFDRPADGLLNIHQGTDRVVINWDSFNIGQSATTQFYQPGSNSLAVNRVLSKGTDPTQILGALKANGRVMVLDRNGVIFGANSRVDVGGIIASTGDVDDNAVMNGDAILQIRDIADGEILNAGTINVSEAGLAAFVAPTVRNSGVINAKLGKVALAAGSSNATVDLYGDGLVEFALDGAKTKALAANSGTINAEGGTVALSAAAAKDVVDDVINMDGVVNVSSVTVKGGKIILGGGSSGKVKVSGKLNASGKTGGEINVTGKDVEISSTGSVINLGDAGETYLYGDKILFAGLLDAGTNATAEVSGKDVTLGGAVNLGDGSTITFDPAILAVGAAETATFVSALNNNNVTVNVTADDQIILNAAIDSSAQVTNSKLNFKDGNADANLQVDLNAYVLLGANQRLIGDASLVNVAASGKIQNGIDVATSGGATLNVAAGTFNENLNISKANLTLNGAKAGVSANDATRNGVTGETVIQAADGKDAIHINKTGITIDGVSIIDGNAGVLANKADGLVVRNTFISSSINQGLALRNTVGFEFTSNHISSTGKDGIDVRDSSDGLIEGNSILHSQQDAIDLDNVDNTDVKSNYIFDTTENGIEISDASDIYLYDNEIQSSGQRGIFMFDSSDALIDDNYIQGSAWDGILVKDIIATESGNAVTISNNNVYDSGYDGIHVNNVTGYNGEAEAPVLGLLAAIDGSDYTVRVIGNDVDGTGDDGIEITDITGNVYISANTIYNAGSPYYNYYNFDGYGADGIHVRNVNPAQVIYALDAAEETIDSTDYSVVIVGNHIGHRGTDSENPYYGQNDLIAEMDVEEGDYDINGAGDDGIEVLNSGRTYIGQNDISFVGLDTGYYGGYYGYYGNESQYGDGIHVDNVFAEDYDGSDSVEIDGNTIYHTGDDGIDVRNSGRTFIHDNSIDSAGYGVFGYYNGADQYGADGIYVAGIEANDLILTETEEGEGYYSLTSSPVNTVKITHNNITTTDDDGIEVDGSSNLKDYKIFLPFFANTRVLIDQNTISNAGAGFHPGYGTGQGSFGGSDADGIHVSDVYGTDYDGTFSVDIRDNTINVTSDDGIEVLDSGRIYIGSNTISNIGAGDYGDGELYNDFGGSDYNGADGISVRYSGSNDYLNDIGIVMRSKLVYGGSDATADGWGYSVQIVDNDIDTTQDDGIEVYSSGRTLIQGNDIRYAGFLDGYDEYGYYSYNDGYGADGIHVRDVFVNEPDYYEGYYGSIVQEEGDGYYSYEVPAAVEIVDNRVNVNRETGAFDGITADDGVQVLYSGDVLIDQNQIANSGYPQVAEDDGYYGLNSYYGNDRMDYTGADGINVETESGYYGSDSKSSYKGYYGDETRVEISNNFVDLSQDDGIEVANAYQVLVDANNVDVSGDEGIVVYNNGFYGMPSFEKANVMLFEVDPYASSAVVTNNTVSNSLTNGIEVANYDQIDASFNNVSNSVQNGLFISGWDNGDVNVEGNFFTNNDVHAHFQSGLIDLTGASNVFNGGRVGLRFAPLQYIDYDWETEAEYVYGQSYLELVDDDAPGVDPAIVNPPSNFGGTIGSQIFNGQSQYFVELDNGAFFEPGEYTWLNGLNSTYNGKSAVASNAADLETMFYHWIDDPSLGRFWFGNGTGAPTIAQEDIFNVFGPFDSLAGQIRVTLLGLPRLPGSRGLPQGGTGPINFNDITPAAGDEETPPQDIAPAAGEETAQNSSCWADASFNAQAGNSTSFSFSSAIDENTLTQDSNCGNSQPQ